MKKLFIILLFLTACGGGSGGGVIVEPPKVPPVEPEVPLTVNQLQNLINDAKNGDILEIGDIDIDGLLFLSKSVTLKAKPGSKLQILENGVINLLTDNIKIEGFEIEFNEGFLFSENTDLNGNAIIQGITLENNKILNSSGNELKFKFNSSLLLNNTFLGLGDSYSATPIINVVGNNNEIKGNIFYDKDEVFNSALKISGNDLIISGNYLKSRSQYLNGSLSLVKSNNVILNENIFVDLEEDRNNEPPNYEKEEVNKLNYTAVTNQGQFLAYSSISGNSGDSLILSQRISLNNNEEISKVGFVAGSNNYGDAVLNVRIVKEQDCDDAPVSSYTSAYGTCPKMDEVYFQGDFYSSDLSSISNGDYIEVDLSLQGREIISGNYFVLFNLISSNIGVETGLSIQSNVNSSGDHPGSANYTKGTLYYENGSWSEFSDNGNSSVLKIRLDKKLPYPGNGSIGLLIRESNNIISDSYNNFYAQNNYFNFSGLSMERFNFNNLAGNEIIIIQVKDQAISSGQLDSSFKTNNPDLFNERLTEIISDCNNSGGSWNDKCEYSSAISSSLVKDCLSNGGYYIEINAESIYECGFGDQEFTIKDFYNKTDYLPSEKVNISINMGTEILFNFLDLFDVGYNLKCEGNVFDNQREYWTSNGVSEYYPGKRDGLVCE